MKRLLPALFLAFFALPASAQTPAAPPASSPRPAQPAHKPRVPLQEAFEQANVTHDGHLTLEQAKAADMSTVARHFTAIDKDKKGYVTVNEIREYFRANRHARSTAKPAAPPPAATPQKSG
jgi:hypothetical protein